MNQNEERYWELAEKWLNGTITPEEAEEYARWYNSIDDEDTLEVPANWAADREEHRLKILDQLNRKRNRVIHLKKRRYWTVAAAILLLITGSYLWLYNSPAPPLAAAGDAPIKKTNTDIGPGMDGAILTLPNGHTIVLDTAKNGSLASTGGANVVKSAGSLAFMASGNKNEHAIEYNMLVTPRGRQQQLVLGDGTKVWLDAGSSIRFPTTFTQSNREVTITGEAYFEVAKNPLQPFIVHVNDASIEVLGTHFNVMAYNNEPALETTLLEGAVKFSSGTKMLTLQPGQQSRLLMNNDLKLVDNADVDLATAWKNGIQAFNQADLKSIMRQVERWYDVDVEFEAKVPLRTFSGEIPRSANLSELLKLFEATDIHFSIDAEKKKLTIIP